MATQLNHFLMLDSLPATHLNYFFVLDSLLVAHLNCFLVLDGLPVAHLHFSSMMEGPHGRPPDLPQCLDGFLTTMTVVFPFV